MAAKDDKHEVHVSHVTPRRTDHIEVGKVIILEGYAYKIERIFPSGDSKMVALTPYVPGSGTAQNVPFGHLAGAPLASDETLRELNGQRRRMQP